MTTLEVLQGARARGLVASRGPVGLVPPKQDPQAVEDVIS